MRKIFQIIRNEELPWLYLRIFPSRLESADRVSVPPTQK